jgi:hypothetical protein
MDFVNMLRILCTNNSRRCGGRDNLLEPRSHCRSPRVQIAAVISKSGEISFYRTGRLFLGNFSSRLKWLWKPFEITATATEWLKNAGALPD